MLTSFPRENEPTPDKRQHLTINFTKSFTILQFGSILMIMFKPKFELTPKLLGNITKIERLYGQIEGLKIPQKLELNLHRDNLIQSSYASNSIEGNPLSLREVTNLLLGERVPVNREEKEVKNYFDILQNLKNYAKKELDLPLIMAVHQQLMKGVKDEIAGKIRNKRVVVGKYAHNGKRGDFSLEVKHEPPFHQSRQIIKALEELISWLNRNKQLPVVIQAGIFHHHFVYLHPFIDGNGRTARLLTALIFLKNNYQINKYFILDDYYDIDRILYSDKLHRADLGDKTEWLEYFSDGVLSSLQGALVKIEEALFKLRVEEKPTPKEREVLVLVQEREEITSKELATILKISRQQAHNLLSSLVKKDFLRKRGTTKGSYYLLK
jgi:Fic family protein